MIRLHSLRAAKFKQLEDVALAFPAKGSVLVQGLNEAGKSTLFESVFFGLFGKALVTEEPNRLDDLINYQAPRALVKLTFSTDTANFRVSRTLNRGKPNTAVLEIDYAGGKQETVTNLSAVNRRVADELGFDSEALLNSCFVEQKKLEKLESMTAQQRRDTLLRLLNLDRITALESHYKSTNADDYQLQQLRDRLKLAEIQRDLPSTLTRLEGVEAELRVIAGLRLLHEIAELEGAIVVEQRRQAELAEEAAQLDAKLAEVDRLKTVRDLSRSARETLLAIDEELTEIAAAREELGRLEAEAARLPELAAEQARLERLAGELADLAQRDQVQASRRHELARLSEALERLERTRANAAERRQQLAALETELTEARASVERADAAERQARQAELLQGWLQICEVAQIAQNSQRQLDALRQDLAGIDGEVADRAAERQVNQWRSAGLAAATLFTLALAAGLYAAGLHFAVAAIPLAAGLLVFCLRYGARARAAGDRIAEAESRAISLRTNASRLEGEQSLAQRTGQDPSRLADIEVELRSLGFEPPASVAEAHDMIERIPAGEPLAAAAGLRHQLGALEGRRQSLHAEIAGLESELDGEGDVLGQHAALAQEIARADEALASARAGLQAAVATEAEARELAAAARAARQAAEQAGRKAGEAVAALEAREQRLAGKRAQLDETWRELIALRPTAEQQVEACRALWRETGEAIAALDEPALRQSSAAVNQSVAASQERVRAAKARIADTQDQLAGFDLSGATAPEDLDNRDAQLRSEQRELVGRVAALKERQSDIERQLGLEGVAVAFEEAEQAVALFEEQLEVRRQAYRIVTLARRNIVGKVLPSTIRNMGLLLPLLTNDRYRDVDIDPETYKIKVWDETARAMKAKDIFSGGTRDQFSLALRLAFALATLPEELGTAPGFIFLDEPLSSFDSVRTTALVNLLTRGPVAANFEQIFVISHNRGFDDQLFDYHLHLESGRVTDTDLPSPPADSATAAQQPLQLAAV